MSKEVWVTWNDPRSGATGVDTVDGLLDGVNIRHLRKAFVEQRRLNVSPGVIEVRATENGEKLSASTGLNPYFVVPADVEAGPGKSEDDPLFLTLPMQQDQQLKQQQQEQSEMREEVREMKKRILEKTMQESKACSYAEYYQEKLTEGRIEQWDPTPAQSSYEIQLPAWLEGAPINTGSERDIVKPFWKEALEHQQIFPTWSNGYEVAHLGTNIPDIAVFTLEVERPTAADFVSAGDCKGSGWNGTSSSELGLLASNARCSTYTAAWIWFVTNNHLVVLVKGYRPNVPPFPVRWCISGVLNFEQGMKLWLQLMRESTGYSPSPTLNGFPITFRQMPSVWSHLLWATSGCEIVSERCNRH